MFSAASVCLFVCQHDSCRTSKHRMMKLRGRTMVSVQLIYCWMFSAASVCLFVCQHDNFPTSKHRMMKLGARTMVSVQLIYGVSKNWCLTWMTNYLTVFYQINVMSYINCCHQNVIVACRSDHGNTNFV